MGKNMSQPKPTAPESLAYTVATFCAARHISRGSFYNLLREGKGPRLMRIGTKPLISAEAAADWRKQMEADTAREAGEGIDATNPTGGGNRRAQKKPAGR